MRGIDKLHPELQKCVNKFLAECKKQGLNVCITETLRTKAEQEALYAQGRTKPGKIVTNCKGYQSAHMWGIAFDFCRNVKGKEYDNSDKFFDKVGKIAKTIFDNTEYDLFWGGDFKSFVDKPHIEMIKYMPNNSTKWLINKYGTPENFMKTWKKESEEDIMFNELLKEGYTKEQIKAAIIKMIKATEGGEETSLKDYVDYMKKEKIMNGYTDGTFKPNNFITRAEVAVVATKLHKQIKQNIGGKHRQ